MTKIANINIIVAASKNNCIGKEDDLPWDLPTDMKRFKKLTNGHVVVMGRKTFETIPEKYRPLPNRTNVIITRNKDYKAEGCEIRHDLQKALDEFVWGNTEVFVMGGGEIYKEAFSYANQFMLTRIDAEVEGDTFLEGFDENKWELINSEEPIEENGLSYTFEDYKRI
jgi:dihydrofolate reductase